MKVDLTKEDILNEIFEFHQNDEDFVLEMIDYACGSLYQEKIVLKHLIIRLKEKQELTVDELNAFYLNDEHLAI